MFDKSYFFWLISYFLPIASHLEMDIFKQLNDVISVDIISYLTWELARESEEFEMNSPRNSRESVDQQPGLRRMHLGLKAMRECLQTLEAHFSRITIHQGGDGCGSVCEDTKNVYKLRNCLADANDLRQLLLLQLRQFNPRIQSKNTCAMLSQPTNCFCKRWNEPPNSRHQISRRISIFTSTWNNFAQRLRSVATD